MRKTAREQQMQVVSTVDAIGLFCPMPVVRLRLEMENRRPGEIVELLADDPGVEDDLPVWCKETGHLLMSIQRNEEGIFVAYVQATGGAEP